MQLPMLSDSRSDKSFNLVLLKRELLLQDFTCICRSLLVEQVEFKHATEGDPICWIYSPEIT